jgi:hypothetical protein
VATQVETSRERRLNLYEVLQVSTIASPEVVQAAYRALARAYHPDVNPSPEAARQMRQLNAAYGVLSDPEKRARYDAVRVRPMRARRDPAPTEPITRPVPRTSPNLTVIRGGATTVTPRVSPGSGPKLGRVLFALAFLMLLFAALGYGVYLAAGALEDEPVRAMTPNLGEPPQVVIVDGR